jgi:hypothetical protein
MAKSRSGDGIRSKSGYDVAKSTTAPELHVTAGGILSPVQGFRGAGVTGTPPEPKHRGFPKAEGDGGLPGGKRKMGGNDAMKAFGLQGTGKNDQ